MTEREENRKGELEKIRKYLPLKDYIRRGPIYSSWSLVAKKRYHSPRFGLPLLVIQDPNKIETRFFNLSMNKVYYKDFHELRGRCCCGSSHGWLVTIDFNLEMYLFDPFSKSQIKLPSLLSPDPPLIEMAKNINFDIALRVHKTEVQVRRDMYVYKVILSADPRTNSDYMVIAIFEWSTRLAFWRQGDSTWATKYLRKYGDIIDILWHKRTLYILTSRNFLFTLVGPFAEFILINPNFYLGMEMRHLVELRGELHIILRHVEFISARTTSFIVLKFNPKNEHYTRLKSIGDNALFLGVNHSIAVPSNEFIGCQSHSIYFTDDYFIFFHPRGFEDLGLFDIKDGTIQQFPSSDVYTPEEFPPLWLEVHPW